MKPVYKTISPVHFQRRCILEYQKKNTPVILQTFNIRVEKLWNIRGLRKEKYKKPGLGLFCLLNIIYCWSVVLVNTRSLMPGFQNCTGLGAGLHPVLSPLPRYRFGKRHPDQLATRDGGLPVARWKPSLL